MEKDDNIGTVSSRWAAKQILGQKTPAVTLGYKIHVKKDVLGRQQSKEQSKDDFFSYSTMTNEHKIYHHDESY